MEKRISKKEDCYLLAKKLMQDLGSKIEFFRSINSTVPSGKYLSTYRRDNNENLHFGHWLPFYFEYSKNDFLTIGVGVNYYGTEKGEQLAALSDFYEVISGLHGCPTMFYTMKKDNLIYLGWSFINKEEEIKKKLNNKEIESLIIIDDVINKKMVKEDDDLRKIGLPIELYPLVSNDIESFLMHKTGKEMHLDEKVLLKWE